VSASAPTAVCRVRARAAAGGASRARPRCDHPSSRCAHAAHDARVDTGVARHLLLPAACLDLAATARTLRRQRPCRRARTCLRRLPRRGTESGQNRRRSGSRCTAAWVRRETGVAQYFRDIRIVDLRGHERHQAADLIGRKVLRDGGATVAAFGVQMCLVDAPLPCGRSVRDDSISPSAVSTTSYRRRRTS
jgi:hypothetical protein